ncbi:MAG TPA: hypothetical protein VFV70_13370 [Hyphomonadaceae bacterium]|nr:hypothetical protein [Hyphomonadaceae bacterium]
MKRLAPILAALAVIAGCSTVPTVTKETTTLGEANISGMECRRGKPIDTNLPRTICASPKAWAAYDEQARMATDDLLFRGRELGNAFARP